MNEYLPEYMFQTTIKDMIVGEQAFTVPWSIQVDQYGQCWIRGDYPFTHEQFGTSRMPIRRTFDGFEVQVPRGTQFDQVHISSNAALQMALLPVVKIS